MSGTQFVGANAVYPGLPLQTAIQKTIPSYLYQEYADDDNLQALVMAQNATAQEYLLWFNTLNLPIYTGGVVQGALLDWVAEGLYGLSRPSVTSGSVTSVDATNSYPTNTVATNARKVSSNESIQSVNDDIFRRMLTWNLYKGDGFQFNIQWLKRRVYRFINGPNGISPTIDQTYEISVSVSETTFTVDIITAATTVAGFLNSLIQSGACLTPFQYSFDISSSTNLENDGGLLQLYPTVGYRMSASGLAAGSVWDDGGVIAVVPGITPDPTAPPVYFGTLTSLDLLALGGGNLPLSNPGAGTLQLWNNGDVVCVA